MNAELAGESGGQVPVIEYLARFGVTVEQPAYPRFGLAAATRRADADAQKRPRLQVTSSREEVPPHVEVFDSG